MKGTWEKGDLTVLKVVYNGKVIKKEKKDEKKGDRHESN